MQAVILTRCAGVSASHAVRVRSRSIALDRIVGGPYGVERLARSVCLPATVAPVVDSPMQLVTDDTRGSWR